MQWLVQWLTRCPHGTASPSRSRLLRRPGCRPPRGFPRTATECFTFRVSPWTAARRWPDSPVFGHPAPGDPEFRPGRGPRHRGAAASGPVRGRPPFHGWRPFDPEPARSRYPGSTRAFRTGRQRSRNGSACSVSGAASQTARPDRRRLSRAAPSGLAHQGDRTCHLGARPGSIRRGRPSRATSPARTSSRCARSREETAGGRRCRSAATRSVRRWAPR